MDEEERMRLAEGEIDRLDALEKDWKTYLLRSDLSAAQEAKALEERRKIVELRANLSGALRMAPVEGH